MSQSSTDFIVVLVTAAAAEEAERIAEALVSEQLAACVNIVGPILSVYIWEKKLQREAERLLIIKTRAAQFSAVEQRVRQLHSYETPEVIALPVTEGSQPYLRWLESSVRAPDRR